MKHAFWISIALFAFVVACGKKDKKLGQAGKTSGQAQLDCVNKDKDTQKCKEELAKKAQQRDGAVDPNPNVAASGTDTPKDVVETIPNVNDVDLKENAKMAITLSDNAALMADLRINANNNELVSTKVICTDLQDLNNVKDIEAANPDALTNIGAHIFLLNYSSMAADLNVKNGDKTTEPKTYLLTCNSMSSSNVTDYLDPATGQSKIKNIEVRQLKVGQQAFEVVNNGKSPDIGILTSFECNNDDDVLKSRAKLVGKKAANRVRLRKGSSVLVFRAVDMKEGDKKIKELGTEAQKDVKYSIVSCNS